MNKTEGAVEMTGCRKRGKPKAGFPSASHTPWKSLRDSHIPTAPATAIYLQNPTQERNRPLPVTSLPPSDSFFNEKMLNRA